jgi:hypothetical protein
MFLTIGAQEMGGFLIYRWCFDSIYGVGIFK